MPPPPSVLVHHTGELLAAAVCARLVTRLVDVQASGRTPRIVLTGGSVAERLYTTLADLPARDAVDWSRVEVWWGDERFLPAGHPERNETMARVTLLDRLPLDPARVHPMPATDGPDGDDPDAAAAAYARLLASAAQPEDHGPVPGFDVVLLGMGPDGHVASLFPERPALYESAPTAAVRHSPKPPPTRITLTLPALRRGQEVWLLVTSAEKAPAVRLALGGAGEIQVPAAGAYGRSRTLWFLDDDAAAQLPSSMPRLASP